MAADYDDDGKTDFAVWRPATGVWLILRSSDEIYQYKMLGVAGDQAIESAYTTQIGSVANGDVIGPLRLKPGNATGGTNLYSQNFGWSTSLVNLPGRAGLDLSLGISANSLVWIKSDSAMLFDPDHGNAGPGFRFGPPVVEPVYYDGTKGVWTFLMVSTSGARVEFRQLGASANYETYDSSYMQLAVDTDLSGYSPNDPPESKKLWLKTTDGAKMRYEWFAGAYRCTKIIDSNGNYITFTNDADSGVLTSITDTLGRVVNISYNADLCPTSITQTWKDGNGGGSNTNHTWASFDYTTKTVSTSFGSGITNLGPPNGTSIKVLDKITYADGSATGFDYNGYIQVTKVRTIAPDSSSHVLNYVSTNLASPTPTPDCPRFTQTKTYAEDFNGGNEVTVSNDAPAGSSFSAGSISESSTSMVKVTVTNHPTSGFYTMIHYAPSGYREGLTVATEDCVGSNCSDRKRWTWTGWDQDNTALSYTVNPRVIETRVGDGTHTKKTEIIYVLWPSMGGPATAYFGLVAEEKIGDASTVKKRLVHEYVTSANYVNRRMVGLKSQTRLYDGNGLLMSKVKYAYDDYTTVGLTNLSNATQHDTSSYGTTFSYRGNVTSVTRCDDTSGATTCNNGVTSYVAYNIAGLPVSTTDPRGRVSTISYTDDWYDNVSRTTYAYPTTVTDPGGYSSTIEYRYDFGANVWAQSPAPNGASNGKKTSRTYEDTSGRISKEKIENSFTGFGTAYTRYSYNSNGTEVTSFSTIVDTDNDGGDTDDEVATVTYFDGAGRVIKSKTDNPNSIGGYTGKQVVYDILGRAIDESVPTEMSTSWTSAAGDDATRGWIWNHKEYDWKGRVTRLIPSDSTGSDDKDTVIQYTGCGCAGGQETTIMGPKIVGYNRANQLETQAKRPMRKVYEDILGRTVKTEVWDFYENGPTAPYSTTVTNLNGRDQPTSVVQYVGSTSGAHQDTEMTYDGHGRLSSLHKPEWYGTHPINDKKYTTTFYNADDTVNYVVDPRGAVTTYTYENYYGTPRRPLVTGIAYATPNPNPNLVTAPAAVSFTYDPAGNRATMSDGTGTLTYSYDELSRLVSEAKHFADNLQQEPQGGYVLSYTYHLGGQLKSITSPNTPTASDVVNYSADKTGRIISIGNASSLTAYANGIGYRSFGAVKSMSMTTTAATSITMTYDDALRPLTYHASNSTAGDVQKANYTYHKDGMLKEIDNLRDGNFDQTNDYDFAGRLKENRVGSSGAAFWQKLSYDAFSNLNARDSDTWGLGQIGFSASYTNNRNGDDTYDNAGNVIATQTIGGGETIGGGWYNDDKAWKFDASGRMNRWEELGPWGGSQGTARGGESTFDGDGRPVKYAELEKLYGQNHSWTTINFYYLYSSVTGQKITDINFVGEYAGNRVYMGDTVIHDDTVYQGPYWDVAYRATGFRATDPVSGSTQEINADGTVPTNASARNELAGNGTSIPSVAPTPVPQPNYYRGADPGDARGCELEGMPVECSRVSRIGQRYGVIDRMGTVLQWTVTQHQLYVGGHRENKWVDKAIGWGEQGYKFPNDQVGFKLGEPWYESSLQVFSAGVRVPNAVQTGPTPLSGDPLARWRAERDRLVGLLSFQGDKAKSECRKYLESLGLNVSAIMKNIATQVPYDPFASLNDANEDFGQLGITVKEFFDNWEAQGVTFEGAATGNTGRIYYAVPGIRLAVILHETIHATHKGAGERKLYDPGNPKSDPMTGVVSFGPGSALILDSELQTKMGITVQGDSRNITNELEKHGCK